MQIAPEQEQVLSQSLDALRQLYLDLGQEGFEVAVGSYLTDRPPGMGYVAMLRAAVRHEEVTRFGSDQESTTPVNRLA